MEVVNEEEPKKLEERLAKAEKIKGESCRDFGCIESSSELSDEDWG